MTSERELEALARESYVMHMDSSIEQCPGLGYTPWAKQTEVVKRVWRRKAKNKLARRVQPARVPEGWQLVPCEASEEMWSATTEVSQYVAFDRFARDYKRLLSAAPAAEGMNTQDQFRQFVEMCANYAPENVSGEKLSRLAKRVLADNPAPESREADHSVGVNKMVPEATQAEGEA